ncbi:MAG: site-specific DNA-methyltransferase [Gammaproteobacteria bacterium]|nr:site-specific DNA-methyltransferase [Gammaproteobacteria bacterium]
MAIRLIEMRRILKPTGTIYLHCDPKMNHYLKLLLDAILGVAQYRNELIWYYRGAGTPNVDFARRHDVIFRYSGHGENMYFDPDPGRQPYAQTTIDRFSHYIGNVRDGIDYGVQTLNDKGKHPDDVITDIQPVAPSAKIRFYPTQKPIPLLERLNATSSKEGDMVFDPFCGGGTTMLAAEYLNRQWAGCDIEPTAPEYMLKILQHESDKALLLNDMKTGMYKLDMRPGRLGERIRMRLSDQGTSKPCCSNDNREGVQGLAVMADRAERWMWICWKLITSYPVQKEGRILTIICSSYARLAIGEREQEQCGDFWNWRHEKRSSGNRRIQPCCHIWPGLVIVSFPFPVPVPSSAALPLSVYEGYAFLPKTIPVIGQSDGPGPENM